MHACVDLSSELLQRLNPPQNSELPGGINSGSTYFYMGITYLWPVHWLQFKR